MIARVVLDTGVVRNHIHDSNPQLDFEAIKSSSEQLRFSIAGGAGIELLEQLTRGSIDWDEWSSRIGILDRILDSRWPMIPSGKQLAALAELQNDIEYDINEDRSYMQEVWKFQSRARSADDLGAKLDPEELKKMCKQERKDWIEHVHKMQIKIWEEGLVNPSEDEILQLGRGESHPGDPHDYNKKTDAIDRAIAQMVKLSLKRSSPYNPSGDKRKGDTFDIQLLFAIPLPVVICTSDEKFVNRLRSTNTTFSNQVVTIDELNQLVIENNVAKQVESFRTPDEQHDRWKDAAYFHWLERDCPEGEPDVDWLATEPIA